MPYQPTTRLERNSHSAGDRSAAHCSHHVPRQQLSRHSHRRGFAAIVLSGDYVEAGDSGRHRMQAGDVLLHQAWESHLDTIGRRGAEVLMLDLGNNAVSTVAGRVADPFFLARIATRDPHDALSHLLATFEAKLPRPADWPDLLALALRTEPTTCLHAWAETHGLHPGSLSRGFRQVFGVTPVAYRLALRTGQAVRVIQTSRTALYQIAQDCGFSDQAHMSRSVRLLSNATPAALRD